MDKKLVVENNWKISPNIGVIRQAMFGSEMARMGEVKDVEIRNGTKRIIVKLEVGNLSGGEKVILGLDLFDQLGYQIQNIPILFPASETEEVENKKKRQREITKEDAEELQRFGIGGDGIPKEWRKVLEDNMALPVSSTCPLPESVVSINTGDNKPVWIWQYPIVQGLMEKVNNQVEEWKLNKWISPAPHDCQWNLPLIAASKAAPDGGPSEDIQLCLDGRAINAAIVDVPDSNLPGI